MKRAAASVIALATFLSACSDQEPLPDRPLEQQEDIIVGANGFIPEQRLLAEIYTGGFDRVGREATMDLEVAVADRVDAVRTGVVTVSFGCTGELLQRLNPSEAEAIHEEYAADDNPNKASDPEWRDRVYDAMSASFPGDVMATDPSNAQACDWLSDADEDYLPQHLVPFYKKPALDRHQRVEVLNRIAGSISTGEIDEMNEDVADGEAPDEIAREWLNTSRFATG